MLEKLGDCVMCEINCLDKLNLYLSLVVYVVVYIFVQQNNQ